jgi:hypothetical protein
MNLRGLSFEVMGWTQPRYLTASMMGQNGNLDPHRPIKS